MEKIFIVDKYNTILNCKCKNKDCISYNESVCVVFSYLNSGNTAKCNECNTPLVYTSVLVTVED